MDRTVAASLAALALAGFGCVMPPRTACPPEKLPPREWLRDPERAFDFFRECLRCGEYRLAYGSLATETRRRLTEDEFLVLFRESPDHYRAVAFSRTERVDPGPGDGARVLTVRHGPSGERHRIRLRLERGLWTLAEDPDAFREFVRRAVRGERERSRPR